MQCCLVPHLVTHTKCHTRDVNFVALITHSCLILYPPAQIVFPLVIQNQKHLAFDIVDQVKQKQ